MLSSYKTATRYLLQKIGHLIPNIPKLRAFGNIVLSPIHNALNLGGGVTDVLGLQMKLDPSECVDRRLWFTPHLYDRGEIQFAISRLARNPEKGCDNVFIDAGSNIGFWSLMIAKLVLQVRVISVEANPVTAKILEDNISLNNLTNIEVVQKGLGGAAGKFTLFCGNHGNRGGDSFKYHYQNGTEILVDVITLKMLCDEYNVKSIRFMKMDIEGVESEVLESFFINSPIELYPKHICLESTHDASLDSLMTRYHYELIKVYPENSIYGISLNHVD